MGAIRGRWRRWGEWKYACSMYLKRLCLVALVFECTSRAGGGDFKTVATGKAGTAYVVFSEAGSVEYGTRKLNIVLYAERGGRLLWRRQVDGRLYETGNSPRNLTGWGVADSVLWVRRKTGGEGWMVDNLGFRLSDGQPLWENIDVGPPLAVAGGLVLFRRLQSQLARPDLRQIHLVMNDLKTGVATRLNLYLPPRANCGDINDYSYEDAAYLERWADSQFLYAQHKDACGVFVARFNWHENETQIPTVTPR